MSSEKNKGRNSKGRWRGSHSLQESYGTHGSENHKSNWRKLAFNKLVERAIQDAHAFIKKHSNVSSVEAVLPNMTPDVCIVNFYTDTRKLGLHQDQDESPESLHRELPVVSFSLGDSVEFLYGDDRDADKANKVTLEPGGCSDIWW